MSLSNCPRCKRVFNKNAGVSLCDACRQREEEDFDLCYQFLRKQPNASIAEVSEETGVEKARIMEFYRNGRLIAGDAGYPCEKCGGPTHRGAYCDKCVAAMRGALGAPAPEKLGAPPAGDPDDGSYRRSFSHELRIDRR
ncbi:MAG TPA: hypothetical protein V6D05_12825 [Stenomitos sp.]